MHEHTNNRDALIHALSIINALLLTMDIEGLALKEVKNVKHILQTDSDQLTDADLVDYLTQHCIDYDANT